MQLIFCSKVEIVETTGRFSFSFFEGRISYIRASCNYPTRNAHSKTRISDIRLQSVSFLVSQIVSSRIDTGTPKVAS